MKVCQLEGKKKRQNKTLADKQLQTRLNLYTMYDTDFIFSGNWVYKKPKVSPTPNWMKIQ